MLLKLKKEQSVKLKISIVFIWLVALMMLLNAIYDSYLMYINEYEYPAFTLMPSYMHYLFMGFCVLIAIGLLLKSKVARYILVFFAYLQIVGAIYSFFMNGITEDTPLYLLFFGMGFYMLFIYLLSNDEILKVYKIKSLKWEIVSYFILSMVFYLLFTWYMKSMIEKDEIEFQATNFTEEKMKYNTENAYRVGLAKKLFDGTTVTGCVAGKDNTAYLITVENRNFEEGAAYRVLSYSFGEPKYDEPWAPAPRWKDLRDLKATMINKAGKRCLIAVSATGHIGTSGGCPDKDDFHIHKDAIHGIQLIGEHVYIVGPARAIYRREGVKNWQLFNAGTQDDLMLNNIEKEKRSKFSYAFLSIDGFSENNMYAVGNKGEAWHYDGKKWSKIDLPTNADLHKVHCAKDGYVYISGDEYTILKGKDDNWEYILNAQMERPFDEHLIEAMAWFDGTLYVGTQQGLFQYKNKRFKKIPLTPTELKSTSTFNIDDSKEAGFDSELLEKMALINNLTDETPNEGISCLDTGFGYLLAGRTKGGLYRYDGETWEVVAVRDK